jgi:hypothetical protein
LLDPGTSRFVSHYVLILRLKHPLGTGKSFIGALIAKVLFDYTDVKILVVCYTNHAYNQFLEDLLDIGIPRISLLRIGSKFTSKTEHLGLRDQRSVSGGRKGVKHDHSLKKLELDLRKSDLKLLFDNYHSTRLQKKSLLEFLEFSDGDYLFWEAFQVPRAEQGMTRVGKKNKSIDNLYLIDRWIQGQNAGVYKDQVQKHMEHVWDMKKPARMEKLSRWRDEILQENTEAFLRVAQDYNKQANYANEILREQDLSLIREKRIVGCTTTAAAMYVNELTAFAPDVVLVEEAGEILEPHVITSLGSNTKQLILIGDHKQLRPKCSYSMSVAKGDGYDLNRSLFERLILEGHMYKSLSQQHRMRPEISSLIQSMTYPELSDAPKTLRRQNMFGFQSNVIFMNHQREEDENTKLKQNQRFEPSSKRNSFEVDMVLKCVRYLGQQGYGTSQIVILTPYLGQLHLFYDKLKAENDPILNDLDSHDLVQAGLISSAAARTKKNPIKISTIGR